MPNSGGYFAKWNTELRSKMWNTTGRVLAAKYEARHVESEDISKLVVSRVPATPLKVLEIIQLLKNPPRKHCRRGYRM